MFNCLEDFEVAAWNSRVVCVPSPLSDTAVGRNCVSLRRMTPTIFLTCLSRLSVEVAVILVEADRCIGVSLSDWSITPERDLQTIAAAPTVAPSRGGRFDIPAFALVAVVLKLRHDRKRCSAEPHSTLTGLHPVPLRLVQLHAWLGKWSQRGQRRASGAVGKHSRGGFWRGSRARAALSSLSVHSYLGFVREVIPLFSRYPA